MKDRLITAGGAIAACLIVYSLFFRSAGDLAVTRPLSTEAGRNGYLALANWLTEAGVGVTSWRERFDSLGAGDMSASGNLLLTTMPHRYPLRDGEMQALDEWIRRGNTLVILAALDDSPEWLPLGADPTWLIRLTELTGLGFQPRRASRAGPGLLGGQILVEAGEAVVFSALPHPLMEGVETLEALSDGPSSIWSPGTPAPGAETGLVVRLARAPGYQVDAIWQLVLGQGQILLVPSASLLVNHQIDEADNGVFVANLVRHHLGAGGAFVFDDMHQGLTSLYDPEAFYADGRLHATLAFLLAAWFIYVLGSSSRLAPARVRDRGPRQSDLLAAVGGFMARRLDRRETALILFDEWFAEIRRNRGLGHDTPPPWQALAATPTLGAKRLTELRELYDRIDGGKAVDLMHLNNVLRSAREAIG